MGGGGGKEKEERGLTRRGKAENQQILSSWSHPVPLYSSVNIRAALTEMPTRAEVPRALSSSPTIPASPPARSQWVHISLPSTCTALPPAVPVSGSPSSTHAAEGEGMRVSGGGLTQSSHRVPLTPALFYRDLVSSLFR